MGLGRDAGELTRPHQLKKPQGKGTMWILLLAFQGMNSSFDELSIFTLDDYSEWESTLNHLACKLTNKYVSSIQSFHVYTKLGPSFSAFTLYLYLRFPPRVDTNFNGSYLG